jgi:hypothetical protein
VPSRKQRRRRLKERRHEYEYVYVDEEGHEVDVPEEEKPREAQRNKAPASSRRGTTRAGRRIEPPSWNRVGKRALFLAPVMFILINLMGKRLSVPERIFETVLLLLIFLPFSYFMDSLMYRSYLKRTGAAPPPARRGRSNGNA